MLKGDISNSAAPRLLFVWEGLIAHPTQPYPRTKRRREKAIQRFIESHVSDSTVAARLWELQWRYAYTLDLVTYYPSEVLPYLRDRIDAERLPFGEVTASTPEEVARRCSYTPHLARVYDGDQKRMWTYGPKGRIITDPRVQDFLM